MKKIILIILVIFIITGCDYKKENIKNEIKRTDELIKEDEDMNVKIEINNNEYILNLENNDTVKELINMLPLELTMSDLNRNEKYVYLDKKLTTNSYNPRYIESGDVYLYGDNCLVIFYKSFETSYSYTKIGHIDNFPHFDNNSINVKIFK